MTLANQLTLLRALLALAMFACILAHGFQAKVAALLLFAVASFTDWLDGKIARHTNTITPFGAIADPFVDKILVGGAFVAFAVIRELNVPVWAVFLIIAREMMISSLRALAALKGQVLSADKSGKFKTGFQMGCITVILLLLAAHSAPQTASFHADAAAMYGYFKAWPYYLTIAAMLITWASGIMYIAKHWKLLSESWSARKENGAQ